jgi:hypothetical protein
MEFMLSKFSRDTWHIRRFPCKDISILMEELDECAFLLADRPVPMVTCLLVSPYTTSTRRVSVVAWKVDNFEWSSVDFSRMAGLLLSIGYLASSVALLRSW